MNAMKISYHTLIKNNRLFVDYVTDYDMLRDFFCGDPRRDESYQQVMEHIRGRHYDRSRLASILTDLNTDPDHGWGAGSATIRNIEKLKDNSCGAVVTGQQMGLFGGPLYTLYKAITCVRLSGILEEKFKVPFVPVFWIETEDHDLAEATAVHLVDDSGGLREFRYETSDWLDNSPLNLLQIDENIGPLHDAISELLPRSEFREQVLGELSRCFSPGQRYVDAFARWMHQTLGDCGIILMNSSDIRFKEALSEIYAREVETAPATNNLIEASSRRLKSMGYHAQINLNPERPNFFLLGPARRTVTMSGDRFRVESEARELSRQDLLEIAQSRSSEFSSNVALRPVVQDYLLPTAVYVGGPAEVAYWAQLKDLHAHFGIPAPLVFPRMSITVLEGNIARLLKKYDVEIEALLDRRGGLLSEKVRRSLPRQFNSTMNRTWESAKASLAGLEHDFAALDVNLKPPFRRFMGKLEHQWKILFNKASAVYEQNDEIMMRQKKKIESFLIPRDGLQERTLNILQFYLKYGESFVERLFREPEITPPWEHQVMEF